METTNLINNATIPDPRKCLGLLRYTSVELNLHISEESDQNPIHKSCLMLQATVRNRLRLIIITKQMYEYHINKQTNTLTYITCVAFHASK
jgi:hypothetical protein